MSSLGSNSSDRSTAPQHSLGGDPSSLEFDGRRRRPADSLPKVPLSLALAVTEARLAERRQNDARNAEREGLPHGSVDDARELAKAIRQVADKLSGDTQAGDL